MAPEAPRHIEHAAGATAAGTARRGVVGLVVPDLMNPFWADVSAGVEARAAARGRLVMVSSTQGIDSDRERDLVATYRDLGVDGLILSTFLPARIVRGHLDGHLPTVLVGRRGHQLEVPSVSVDEVAVMSSMLGHVLALGHRRTAFVNGSTSESWCAERRQGWLTALRRRGLSGSPAHVEITVPDVRRTPGTDAVAELLRLRPMPTALLCANDVLAIDVLRALREAGVAVPEHVSVIGVDDTVLASVSSPALTTVRQDPVALGAVAVDLLVDGPGAGRRNLLTTPELVVRASTAAPPPERVAGRPARAGSSRQRADGAEDVMDRIWSAAVATLDEAGADAITARSVAARAGISLGTIAYHLNTDDLRDRLWQEVEGQFLAPIRDAPGPDEAAERMVEWMEHHRSRASFFVSHAPDPHRPIRTELLAALGASPSNAATLELRRAALRYLARRLQAAAEYSMLAPDRAGSIGVLAAELREQARLWHRLIEQGGPAPA